MSLIGEIASLITIGSFTKGKLDERAKLYSDWILANICNGNEDAIVDMEVEINPRVDCLNCVDFVSTFRTKCKRMNWEKGYITVEGEDYESPAELYVQRCHKINGVRIPDL